MKTYRYYEFTITMAVADIIKKILTDAERETQQHFSGAESQIKKLEEETDAKKNSLHKDSETHLSNVIKENNRRVLSAARDAGKQRVERVKRELIEEVYVEVASQFEKLSGNFKERLSKFLREISEEESGTLIVPKGKSFDAREVLLSFQRSFDVEEDENLVGGFQFRGKKFDCDLSLHTLLSRKKDDLEPEISKILFS